MTIKQYLFKLEYLKERCDRKRETYIRLSERVLSPGSSFNFDEIQTKNSGTNKRELLLVKSAAALEELDKAIYRYLDFKLYFCNTLSELEPLEDLIMQELYIKNIGLPFAERYNKAGEVLKMRPQRIPAKEKEAERHLIEILRKKGIEING